MDNQTRQMIQLRLEQLKTERDRYITQANQQLFGYQAVLSELERLLNPEKAVPPATSTEEG